MRRLTTGRLAAAILIVAVMVVVLIGALVDLVPCTGL